MGIQAGPVRGYYFFGVEWDGAVPTIDSPTRGRGEKHVASFACMHGSNRLAYPHHSASRL